MARKKQSDRKYNSVMLSFWLTFGRQIQSSKIKNITLTNGKIRNTAITIKANKIANKKSVAIYKKSRNNVNCHSSLSPGSAEFWKELKYNKYNND